MMAEECMILGGLKIGASAKWTSPSSVDEG